MRLHLPVKLRSALLSALVAVSFTVSSPAWAVEEDDDAEEEISTLTENHVYANGTWAERITDSVTLDDYSGINISNMPEVQDGGAIYLSGKTLKVAILNSGNIFFKNNTVSYSGGGIYNASGSLTFDNNGDISFTYNSALPSGHAIGGAINNEGSLSFTNNGNITFSDNVSICDSANAVEPLAYGGAIHNYKTYGNPILKFEKNGDIIFSRNKTEVIGFADAQGGAIYNSYNGTLSFEYNGDILFTSNSATGDYFSSGGAIDNGGTMSFEHNGEISFSDNSAIGVDYSSGGAIANHGTLSFEYNSDVSFSNNSASSRGGAIYNASYSLAFTGNGNISFQGNFETDSRILRSLYSSRGNVILSAATGKSITFYDSIYSSDSTTVELNRAYTDAEGNTVAATGAIVFSGATTEADLTAAFERNDITQAPTARQIQASHTSEIGKATTLYAGSLGVRDQAVLNAAGLTIKTSANTVGGTRVVLHNGTLNSDVAFEGGTYLQISGANTGSGTFTFADGAGLCFDLTGATVGTPLFSLSGTLVQEGALVLDVSHLKGGDYILLTSTGAFDTGNWTADKVTVNGVAFEDLVWEGNSLMLSIIASSPYDGIVLTGGEKMIDAGVTLTPEYIEVSGDKDSNITGGGSLAGDGDLDKTGTGNLTISTANPDWTGEIHICGGTVTAGSNTALGTGTVNISSGALDMGGFAVANTVNIGKGSLATIVNGSKFAGTVNLNGGTLTLTQTLGGTLVLNGGLLDLSGMTGSLGTVTTSALTKVNVGDISGLTAGTHTLLSFADGSGIDTRLLQIAGMEGIEGWNKSLKLQNGQLLLVLSEFTDPEDDVILDGGEKVLGDGETITPGLIEIGGSSDSCITGGGSIAGDGELNKFGSGSLTIDTENPDWTGEIHIDGGKVIAGTDTALGAGDVYLGGGNLDLGGKAVCNAINVKTNATINGAGNYQGGLTLNDGTLSGGAINLGQDATLNNGTINNRLTGMGGVNKNGSGTVTLNGANTFTGDVNVNSGTLITGSSTALGAGRVNLKGGTLNMGGRNLGNDIIVVNDSALTGAGGYQGTLTLRNGMLTGGSINISKGKIFQLENGTLSNKLIGDGGVSKLTTGTVTLNGASTYTGGTTISAGTLAAGNAKAFGTGGITLSGGTLHLNFLAVANAVNANGTASLKGGTKYAGNLTLTKGTLSGDKINLASGKTTTLKAGTIKNVLSGSGKVVKDTTGTAYLYGANTYTGGTTVKAGTLSAKNVKALGTGAVTMTGGSLYLNSLAVANNITVSGTAALKGGTKYAGNLTLTKGALSGDKINLASGKTATLKSGTLKNVFSGAGKVVKDTAGTVTLNGANTYTGGTTVKAGTLSTKNVKALGTKTATLTGGTLHLNSLAVANDINVNATSATIKGGAKYKGKLTLTKGTLSGDKLNIASGKNAYLKTGTVKNALGGTGTVYKQGTGTVTLAGANNWTGNTYVQGGTLVLTGATVLRGSLRTYAGSKLDIRRAVTMGNLYLGGGTLALKAGNMLTVTGTLTLANATKLALSGLTASSPVLIKYGKLSNTSKKSLNQFFGLSGAYKVTNAGGRLTISLANAKQAVCAVEPEETFTVSPNALGQSTWGVARAARLFDHTVRDHAQAQSVALDKNRSVWFAGMSGFSHVDDAADTNIYGGAVGMQFNGSMGGNVGIAIGQTYDHVSPAGATRVKQQTQHAALYGTKMLYTSASDSVSLTGTASYGTTDSDHETLDWTQHSAVLGVRGTWEHKVSKSTCVYGFAGLEYLATDSESGSGSIQALQGSVGAGISHTTGRLTLHADASFAPDMVRNVPFSTVNPGRLGFEVGAGARYRINDKWSLNAGYTYHNEKRADSHEAYIGARCTF